MGTPGKTNVRNELLLRPSQSIVFSHCPGKRPYSEARYQAAMPPLSGEADAEFLIKAAAPDRGQILRPENGRFGGTPSRGHFTQVLDSAQVAALSYRHALGQRPGAIMRPTGDEQKLPIRVIRLQNMPLISETAKREMDRISGYVESTFAHSDDLRQLNRNSTPVYFCFVAGTHVDPDDGREYVPLSVPLTPARRQQIRARKKKVNRIIRHIRRSLDEGVSIKQVQAEVGGMQKYLVVGLASSLDDAGAVLTAMFMEDYLSPGCVEDDGYDVMTGPSVLYKFYEALPCSGGITDRYAAAEMERLNIEGTG